MNSFNISVDDAMSAVGVPFNLRAQVKGKI